MKGAFIVICVALFLCLVNYGTDLFFFLKDRFARFHIGRWQEDAWKAAVEDRAARWLRRTPVVKITDNSRYMLLDLLQGKYRSQTIQSWQKAALILGLLESGREDSRRKARQYAAELTDGEGNWKVKPTRVDCGMLSFALLRAAEDPAGIRKAMDYSAQLIRGCVAEEGMISYTGRKDDPDRYVDTVGLCSPFLALYAKTYQMPAYEDMAFAQIEKYHTYGLLKGTALPNHAFDARSKLPLGVFGWGRGIGWYVIGLLDTYLVTEDPAKRAALKAWILEAADEYLRYQREDGGFGSIVQSGKTYDSSATAVLSWFYAVCGSVFGRSAYIAAAERCLKKLRKVTRMTGAIDWCQGDTKGIGVFAQTYDVMPFAQGMCLRAIHQLKRK
jgi:unsaturated rhamnogalacturonyl hydrolase